MKRLIWVACDCQISKSTVVEIEKSFAVVFRAQHEADEVWVEQAILKGANVFISPDSDIPDLLETEYADMETYWIPVRQGLRSADQPKYIIGQLYRLQRVIEWKEKQKARQNE